MIEFNHKDNTRYFQCELQQDNKKQVAWIEEKGAVVGKNIELKDDSGRWDVTVVYPTSLGKSVLKEMQENHRNSLPSIMPRK